MQNQSAKKSPQPEKQTNETPTRPEWIVPTLVDLLRRLSVTPASPAKPS
jgi:hypothetical protein